MVKFSTLPVLSPYINMLSSRSTPTEMCGSVACRYHELQLEMGPIINEEEDFTDDEDFTDEEPEVVTIAVGTPEQHFIWSVYGGFTRPADDEEWLEISTYCRDQLFIRYGVVLEHEQWIPAFDNPADEVIFTFAE